MKFILSIVKVAFASALLPCASHSQVSEEVSGVLEKMGMVDVRLEDCILEYSRHIVPTEENNGFYFTTKLLNLNSFNRFNESEIEEINAEGRKLFSFRVLLDDWYIEEYKKVEVLAVVINRRLNGQVWPFTHPFYQSESVPWLNEFIFDSGVMNLGLNMRLDRSNFGEVVFFYANIDFNYDDKDTLIDLKESISRYAKSNGCQIN